MAAPEFSPSASNLEAAIRGEGLIDTSLNADEFRWLDVRGADGILAEFARHRPMGFDPFQQFEQWLLVLGFQVAVDGDALICASAGDRVIAERSFGRVLKPETLNYRTQRAERDGLFCERIFGPTNDLACFCGKFSGAEHSGTTCRICGVSVRPLSDGHRWLRIGHIAMPNRVAPWWAVRGAPSVLGVMTGLGATTVRRILRAEIIGLSDSGRLRLVDHTRPEPPKSAAASKRPTEPSRTWYGGDLLAEILRRQRDRLGTRIADVRGTKPEFRRAVLVAWQQGRIQIDDVLWSRVPIVAPNLRPIISTAQGRWIAHDTNDLWRRLINRTNRLSRLIELNAPEIILFNEYRMASQCVWDLQANSVQARPVLGPKARRLSGALDAAGLVLSRPWVHRLRHAASLLSEIDASLSPGRAVANPGVARLWESATAGDGGVVIAPPIPVVVRRAEGGRELLVAALDVSDGPLPGRVRVNADDAARLGVATGHRVEALRLTTPSAMADAQRLWRDPQTVRPDRLGDDDLAVARPMDLPIEASLEPNPDAPLPRRLARALMRRLTHAALTGEPLRFGRAALRRYFGPSYG